MRLRWMMSLRKWAAVGAALAFGHHATPAMAAGQLYAHSDIELHSGPGPKFHVLGSVPQGTAITVLWCNGTADWCLLDDGIDQGWAMIDQIRSPSSGLGNSGDASSTGDSGLSLPSGSDDSGSGLGSGSELDDGSGSTSGAGVSVNAPGAALSLKLQ